MASRVAARVAARLRAARDGAASTRAIGGARAIATRATTTGEEDEDANANANSPRVETTTLYRRALKRARRLPDPCARHFARERFASAFRRYAEVTSAREIETRRGEAARWTRRLRRSGRDDDDYRAVLERAYGLRGRMKHMVKACEEECGEGAPVKTRRATRFALPATNERTGETYSLRYLFSAMEAQRAAGGETEDESLAAQMRMLRLRVPRYFHPNGVAARATNARANEQTDDASTTADFVRVWPWEAATAEDLANLSPSYGIGTMASAESWEMVHLALLKTTFVPLMMERVKTMSRRSRRVYERTFDLERTFVSVDDIDDVHEGDFSA